jgi:glycolate dehydrogenase iron-sulfur subunit
MAPDAPAHAATGYAALDPCVHCGFCLPACPTYLATGDEADSPRGRIMLMRALERGEMSADDSALRQHLDACLGCRGCEPVCPSGVGYGRGLEAAREQLTAARGLGGRARALLTVFRHRILWRPAFTVGRWLRNTGLPARLSGTGQLGFGMGMLASSASRFTAAVRKPRPVRPDASGETVALFRGCVMDALFDHVHRATRRTLEANGYRVVEVPGQVCCGALHEHAGARADAERLAARNLAAFDGRADYIVVNSAGCGALMKEYAHLLGSDKAREFAGKVRDVSELLAARGPRQGGALPIEVVYDAPCHLQHAQRVHAAPLAVLDAIPGLRLRVLPGSDRCCGSAGIYSMLQPDMARAVLDLKIAELAAAIPRPAIVASGNPGCLMQIGAGLRAAKLPIDVAHPVELLDRAYEIAGFY